MDAREAAADQDQSDWEDALHGDPSRIFAGDDTLRVAQAADGGDTELLRRLVAGGSRLDVYGQNNLTLLQWAIIRNNIGSVNALLDAGANPSQRGLGERTAVSIAAENDDPAIVRTLLDHHADPDATDADGTTPLVAALINGNPEPCDLLLKAGANVNAVDSVGNSILIHAVLVRKFTRVVQLLQLGADPRATNPRHQTFQTYLPDSGEVSRMTEDGKHDLDQIDLWLRDHNVPIETDRRG
jgi:hypothetical protein